MASGDIVVATLTLDFTGGDGGDGDWDSGGSLMLEQIEGKDYALFAGNVEVISHEVIGGGKTPGGSYSKDIDDYITFSNSDTTSLPYPPDGTVTFSPVGQSYKISDTGIVSPTLFGRPQLADNGNCKISGKGIALYKVEYTAKGERFTAVTDLPVVLVFAVGREK